MKNEAIDRYKASVMHFLESWTAASGPARMDHFATVLDEGNSMLPCNLFLPKCINLDEIGRDALEHVARANSAMKESPLGIKSIPSGRKIDLGCYL